MISVFISQKWIKNHRTKVITKQQAATINDAPSDASFESSCQQEKTIVEQEYNIF